MKKILFFAFIALTTAMQRAAAQDAPQTDTPDTTHTLIKLVRPKYLGLYIAPEYQYGQLSNSFTNLGGGSLMLLLNKRFGIGASFSGILNDNFSPTGISPKYLRAGFGGIRMEFTPRPNSAFHLTFPLTIGKSWARADSLTNYNYGKGHNGRDFDFSLRDNDSERVFAQLGMNVEGNLLKYIKFFAGASYRFSFGSNTSTTVPTNALNGVSMQAGLKLGLFDFWIGKKQKSME